MIKPETNDLNLFTEAVQLPAAERAAYLKKACDGDDEVRGRVEALLSAHAKAAEFLERGPAEGGGRTPMPGEKPGDQVGRYKLLQQIGEGGCGVVFMAEQEEPVRRTVALKLIKPGMDTKTVIARFEAERQALALMDHPNIAGVLDAGATESGRPYFVMELVRGIKITDYCDRISATTVERLEMFIQICDAVQHAHHKGIIHRDIKPSNVLVTELPDGRALPKVIDFGIAKATTGQRLTDKTLFTAFELLIGTPAYMSPEQAALSSVDVDTRSDIYSLGVLLYELLAGSTPFDTRELLKAGLDEVRRVICNEEPVPPSTRVSTLEASELTRMSAFRRVEPPKLIRQLRGDLDWIVMKAMEKDRERRYSTANGLALDVRRYLDGEAIAARPPSAVYKFRRLVLRHKLLFSGLGVILALLLACALVSVRLLISERQMRRELEVVRAESEASILFFACKFRAAGDRYCEALNLQLKYFGPNNPRSAELLSSAVAALIYSERAKEAERLLKESRVPQKYGWPQRSDWLSMRAESYARMESWTEALGDASLAIKGETNIICFHVLAPLLVQKNEIKAYRELCAEIVKLFHGTTNAYEADKAAKDCLILPSSGADLEIVGELAQTAVRRGKGVGGYTYMLCTQALADYRRGRFQEVVDETADILKDPFPYSQAEAYATLAMAQFGLNHGDEARAALAKGEKIARERLPRTGSREIGQEWKDWIIAHALLKEAKAMIGGESVARNELKAK